MTHILEHSSALCMLYQWELQALIWCHASALASSVPSRQFEVYGPQYHLKPGENYSRPEHIFGRTSSHGRSLARTGVQQGKRVTELLAALFGVSPGSLQSTFIYRKSFPENSFAFSLMRSTHSNATLQTRKPVMRYGSMYAANARAAYCAAAGYQLWRMPGADY